MNEENIKIPESVLKYGLDFDWDEKDVWALDYPIEDMEIEMLEWHFEIPFWNWNNEWYVISPNDVIKNREYYKEQYDRIRVCPKICVNDTFHD